MLDDQQKLPVKDSWRMVVPIAETAADLFYKRLFELRPDYRAYQLGYETGPIDGVVGPRTTAAIKAFQFAEHLHADGTLSPPTRAVLQRRIGEP